MFFFSTDQGRPRLRYTRWGSGKSVFTRIRKIKLSFVTPEQLSLRFTPIYALLRPTEAKTGHFRLAATESGLNFIVDTKSQKHISQTKSCTPFIFWNLWRFLETLKLKDA